MWSYINIYIYIYTHTHTHIYITPRSSVLSEKLTGPHVVKKFPTFSGNGKFITAFTSTSHLPVYRSLLYFRYLWYVHVYSS